ncbi:MAG: hypothetical protein DDT41_00876 [candidate division WS2 bacterium]|nr:hypothetical protein [Candidatus Psychracetigena formicireducens]
MRLLRFLISIFLISSMFLGIGNLQAEAFAPLITRAGIYGPLNLDTNLVLEQAEITIKLQQAKEEFYPQAVVESLFTLRNIGEAGTFQLGFPLPTSPGLEVVTTGFRLFVNRKATFYNTVLLEGTKDRWQVWMVEAGENQRINVNINYSYQIPLFGWCELSYPLSLLGSFKGNVSQINVKVDFPFLIEENLILDATPKDIRISRNSIIWEGRNLEPASDLNIGFPNLNLWRNMVDARSMVAKSPNSPEMRYLLGLSYLNLAETKDVLKPLIPFWAEQGKRELERSLSLNPRHLGAYRELSRYFELMASYAKDNLPLALDYYISSLRTLKGALIIFPGETTLKNQLDRTENSFRGILVKFLNEAEGREEESIISLSQLLRRDPGNQEISNSLLSLFLNKHKTNFFYALLPHAGVQVVLTEREITRTVYFYFDLITEKWLQNLIKDKLNEEVAKTRESVFFHWKEERDHTRYILQFTIRGTDQEDLEESRLEIIRHLPDKSLIFHAPWFFPYISEDVFQLTRSPRLLWTSYSWSEELPLLSIDNQQLLLSELKKEIENWEAKRLEPALKEIILERLNFFTKKVEDTFRILSRKTPAYQITVYPPLRITSTTGRISLDETVVEFREPLPTRVRVVTNIYHYLTLWWLIVVGLVVGTFVGSYLWKWYRKRKNSGVRSSLFT